MLKVSCVHTYYGNVQALKGIDLEVKEKEIVTLIGGNGAGKTTTLKTIMGLLTPVKGTITFYDQPIHNMSTSDIVKSGICLSPEGRQVFPKMSILENLQLGAYTRPHLKEIQQTFKKVYDLFPILYHRKHQHAGTLSGGEQQMLAIARALMGHPKLLLLDEPSLGLAPMIVQTIFNLIQEINQLGTTILLVEQNAKMSLSIADRGYVLETGRIILKDEAKYLLKSDAVKKAYLGE